MWARGRGMRERFVFYSISLFICSLTLLNTLVGWENMGSYTKNVLQTFRKMFVCYTTFRKVVS